MRARSIGCAVLTAGALVAPAAATAAKTVTLKDIAFHPATVKIGKGGTVRWVWHDGSTQHNVTFSGFHSRTQSSGSYSHRFTRRGTFRYRCTIHPGMNGKVVVG